MFFCVSSPATDVQVCVSEPAQLSLRGPRAEVHLREVPYVTHAVHVKNREAFVDGVSTRQQKPQSGLGAVRPQGRQCFRSPQEPAGSSSAADEPLRMLCSHRRTHTKVTFCFTLTHPSTARRTIPRTPIHHQQPPRPSITVSATELAKQRCEHTYFPCTLAEQTPPAKHAAGSPSEPRASTIPGQPLLHRCSTATSSTGNQVSPAKNSTQLAASKACTADTILV